MERKKTVCISYSEQGCDDIGLICIREYICPHCGAHASHTVLRSYDFVPDPSWEPAVSAECGECMGPVMIVPMGGQILMT